MMKNKDKGFFDVSTVSRAMEKRYKKLDYRSHEFGTFIEKIIYFTYVFIVIRLVFVVLMVIGTEIVESFVFQPGYG